MTRFALAVGLAASLAAPSWAQGLRTAAPPSPYMPGFRPVIQPVSPLSPVLRPWLHRPIIGTPWPGYVFPDYYPYGTGLYYGSSSFYYPPVVNVRTPDPTLIPPPLVGAGGTPIDVQVPVDPELAAELTIEFPAAADVTVNGETAAGDGRVRTLRSPELRAGLTHTFDVKARWTQDGQAYEWERTVTVRPGERSRITVARGFPVKE